MSTPTFLAALGANGPSADRTGKMDPKVKVLIMENSAEGAAGKRPIFLSVNGVAMLVPRAQPADIPYRYYEALKNAVVHKIKHDLDNGTVETFDEPAYAYQVLALPSKAEIDAWTEQTKNLAAA